MRLLATLVLSWFCAASVVQAELRAVLVGVGDYLHIDADLLGPPNDVGLMAEALMRRGVAAANMTVLADPGAAIPEGAAGGLPDRASILAALDAAIAASGAGDTVIFYFSGHGSQAPDTNGDEGGGPDEIFLPRDVKGWNGAAGEVENAIVDDEFALFSARAAERGAALVAIIDACHSGTGFRALGGGEERSRARYVAPALLNLPETVSDAPAAEAAPPAGDYVYLYAAQSDQRAFEYPVGEGADRRWHGDFTRAIAGVMSELPDLSYAQLVAAAAARMQERGGQAAQTPDAEGTMLDAPVIGSDAVGLGRIPVTAGRLQAGLLQDVRTGSKVALYSGMTETDPVAMAVVGEVRAADADLRIDGPAPAAPVTHAVVTERALDLGFAVSFDAGAAARLRDVAPQGVAELANRVDFPVTGPDRPADNRIVWTGDAFALVGRDGVLDAFGPGSSPRLAMPATDPDVPGALAMSLTRIAARARLDRALAGLGKGGATGFALFSAGPEVQFEIAPGRRTAGRCRADGAAEVVTGSARTAHCATLSVTITNPTLSMQDVTVLYIDAESAIEVLWPSSGLSNRIESGGEKRLRFGLRHEGDPGTVARESVLVLSVSAEPGDMRTVFDGLGAGGAARGASSPAAAYLAGLTDPSSGSRSFTLGGAAPDLAVSRLDITLTGQ